MVAPAAFSGVGFSFSPASPTVGQTITFTATVTGGTPPFTFSWNFGDATPNASGNPTSHAYSFKGTFTVTLTVTDSTSPPSTATVTHQITVSPLALTADFTVSPSTPCVGTGVTFTGSVSGGTSPYTFSWSFGDGTRAAGNPAFHVYATLGTFLVTLNVTDINTFRTTVSHIVTVAGCPLIVSITGPSSGTVGTAVTFSATASGGVTPFRFSWNFGDGTPDIAGQTVSHTYVVKSTYIVRVNATDSSAQLATASSSITINPLVLITDFTFNPTTVTTGSPLIFTATTSGGTAPYSYSWDFGDGTTGTANPVQHTYSTAGPFTVRENVTDHNGAKLSITQIVGVLTVTLSCPSTGTVGTAVSCTATASGGTAPFTFSWSFGDGTANVAGTPASHTYTVKGTYTVKVNTTDGNGVVGSASSTITISPLPLATDFTSSAFAANTPVTFTATTTGGTTPYTYAWNFGDGTTGTGNPVQHTYSTAGPFIQRENVTDLNGKLMTATHAIGMPPPSPVITCPTNGIVGTTVACSATVFGGTPPLGFSWTAPGGNPPSGTGPTFSTTYSVKGTYTITVTVTDSSSPPNSATAAANVVIQPLALTTDFTARPSAQCVDQQITYTASVSGGTAPYSFGWNFGDGSAGTGNPTTHIYRVKGTFTVILNVTDSNGTRTSASHVVTALGCAFIVTINGPSSGTVGAPVTFTASATGGIAPYRFSWNFGDGSTNVAGSSAAHTYAVKGTYTVRANATDITGLLTSASTTIAIFPLPLVASFTFSPSSPNVGQPVTFTSIVSGGTAPYIFAWNFGDGTIKTSFASQITHTYSAAGAYTVTFNATDANGVKQSSRPATVTVLNPDFTISANPTTLTLKPETSTTTTITLTSIGGFTGTISLNATIIPTGKQGPSLTLSTTSLTVPPGTPGTVVLTVTAKGSTPLGSYTIMLTATSGKLSHAITIPVTVTKEH